MAIGLMEMEISVLISRLTWIPWKKLTHCLDPPYWGIFKVRNTDLQFWSPGKGEQKNSANCKAINAIYCQICTKILLKVSIKDEKLTRTCAVLTEFCTQISATSKRYHFGNCRCVYMKLEIPKVTVFCCLFDWFAMLYICTGGYRYSGNAGMFLVCHMISEDHMIKGSCDFIGWSTSW